MKKYLLFFTIIFSNSLINAQINYLKPGSSLFTIKNLSINTEHQDFGAIFYKDKIVFSSTNANAQLLNRKWSYNDLPFLDLYIADIDPNTQEFTKINEFNKQANKKYNEGPAAFTADGNLMIFTTNNYDADKSADTFKLELFSSKLVGDKWQQKTALPFNNDKYSVGQAAISPDGKIIFFASNMPGGYGGVDLYISNFNGGKWSTPKNLGNKINTSGNEMFPFLHKDGLLFFSSDGFNGIGGLDVFVCDISNPNNPSTPKNLGSPINSTSDDFSFILDENQHKGYFSSDRNSGKGNDDIYSFLLSEKITLNTIITGTIYNKLDSTVIPNVKITIFNQNNDSLTTITTNSQGEYEYSTNDNGSSFKIKGLKNKYIPDSIVIYTNNNETEYSADLYLEKIYEFNFNCLVINKNNQKIIENAVVYFTDNITGKKDTLFSNFEGKFSIDLTGHKINDQLSFEFLSIKPNFDTTYYSFDTTLSSEGSYNTVIRMKKTVFTVADIIDLNPIFFEFDKYNITSEAAYELDKIVKLMNDKPNMVVEVKSYTDCKGSKSYNMRLSQKRAESTIAYIQDKITNPSRISGQGYGEIDLNTNGDCPPDNQPSPDQQLSRKTEFVIIKM
ncbi:MAG: OmpA family protein [Bacteroidales bacterium]|nr:OmpA family protein [Bacteroidales bacterium]